MSTKEYLEERIGDEYYYWGSGKIFIEAPTGSGKSTFVVKNLLDMYQKRGNRLLILCNRKLLRQQYWYDLARKFERYSEFRKTVEVRTYQELAVLLSRGISMEKILYPYVGICLDEAHYFYSDADFNGFGTHVLLQEIIRSGIEKQLIFMSATLWCVKPLIDQILEHFRVQYPRDQEEGVRQEIFMKTLVYRVQEEKMFEHIQCLSVPDIETLCGQLGTSKGKSLIFIDDKNAAGKISQLLQTCGVKAGEIVVLNAQNLDATENTEVISSLCLAHRILPRVLITTSVLDNGVSVHDPEVENLVIVTDSKVSFLQMLGRLRSESSKSLNMYFLERSASYFARRERELGELLTMFKKPDKTALRNLQVGVLCEFWNCNSKLSEAYRKIFVPIPRGFDDVFGRKSRFDTITKSESVLTVNAFAEEKIGDLYLQEALFHSLAVEDPKKVIDEQLKWMNKLPDELKMVASSFEAEQKEELVASLLEIKHFNVQQLGEKKEELSRKFGKNILRDIAPKNRSFSTEKLESIVEEVGLRLEREEEARKLYFSVYEKSGKEEEECY